MALSAGDRAEEGDIWFRIITDEKYLRHGRLTNGAFSFKPPPTKPGWNFEMSGRLRSQAGSDEDIEKFAHQFCAANSKSGQKPLEYWGVMVLAVSECRAFGDVHTAVHFTPNGEDPAHADFTLWNCPSMEDVKLIQIDFPKFFYGLHLPQMRLLPPAVIKPATASEDAAPK